MQFIVLLFFVITAHAQIRPADQQYIPQENLLLNPGLEQGRVNWTISGAATVSLEQTASAVLAGLSSLKIVASSQTFEVAQFTTKSASSLNGMQAMASVRVKTNQSGVQVCSIENSVHVKCVSVDSTNQTKEYIIPFVFNSTNNGIVIKGASGTGTTYIDDAYVGIMPKNNTIRDNNLILGAGVFSDVDFVADIGNLNNPKIKYNSTFSKWQYSNNGTLFEDFGSGGGSSTNFLAAEQAASNWYLRTTPADNSWLGVTYGNGLFVAVSDTGNGNRVMTSPDGVTWTLRATPADNGWTSVAYGNGLFVAVAYSGTGNRVMTSPDGVNWTLRASAADNQWYGVTYGNGLFVAVAITGTGNRVMTSPDGINWTIRTSAADIGWWKVAYGNGLFVAVAYTGAGNRVMTSPDGVNWTLRASAADANSWYGIAYGNGLFVAVAGSGTGNRVMTSPDGINWTIRTSAADNGWNNVAYGNGLFVAVANSGTGNRVMVSADGIRWITRTSAADNAYQGAVYGNGVFVAVANSGTGNRAMTSPFYDLYGDFIFKADAPVAYSSLPVGNATNLLVQSVSRPQAIVNESFLASTMTWMIKDSKLFTKLQGGGNGYIYTYGGQKDKRLSSPTQISGTIVPTGTTHSSCYYPYISLTNFTSGGESAVIKWDDIGETFSKTFTATTPASPNGNAYYITDIAKSASDEYFGLASSVNNTIRVYRKDPLSESWVDLAVTLNKEASVVSGYNIGDAYFVLNNSMDLVVIRFTQSIAPNTAKNHIYKYNSGTNSYDFHILAAPDTTASKSVFETTRSSDGSKAALFFSDFTNGASVVRFDVDGSNNLSNPQTLQLEVAGIGSGVTRGKHKKNCFRYGQSSEDDVFYTYIGTSSTQAMFRVFTYDINTNTVNKSTGMDVWANESPAFAQPVLMTSDESSFITQSLSAGTGTGRVRNLFKQEKVAP